MGAVENRKTTIQWKNYCFRGKVKISRKYLIGKQAEKYLFSNYEIMERLK